METIKNKVQEIANTYLPSRDQRKNNEELVGKIMALVGAGSGDNDQEEVIKKLQAENEQVKKEALTFEQQVKDMQKAGEDKDAMITRLEEKCTGHFDQVKDLQEVAAAKDKELEAVVRAKDNEIRKMQATIDNLKKEPAKAKPAKAESK